MKDIISATLIVKNEEDHLGECLESIKDVDEIIIVDTGSSDNTIDIAKKYTENVYFGDEYLWRDDFSFSRNQSLELATLPWILVIDADEVLEDGGVNKIRVELDKIEKNNLNIKALNVNTIARSNHNVIHKSDRVFKRAGVKWKGAAHNYLVGIRNDSKLDVDINLYYGYSNAHKLDPDRTFRILKNVCKENPKLGRERYYLAREYLYRKDYETALFHYKKYVEHSFYIPEKADAYLMMSKCCWFLMRGDEARDYCLKCISLNPDFKEALLFMSKIHNEPWKSKWLNIANNATNKDVLFIR